MDCDNQETEATKNMKEKTADEMLEELGYIKAITTSNCIDVAEVWGKYKEYMNEDKTIIFGVDKSIYICDYLIGTKPINMQELQAINKKCEELRLDLRKRGNYNEG